MSTVKFTLCMFVLLAFSGMNEAVCQWAASGTNIYNTNSGNVGIGNNAPATLLYVAKNMQEPTITVRNLGGFGGATYVMQDNASGANWKFKATLNGGFKIRDHANLLDVIVIEPNSAANAIYINAAGSVGLGTSSPAASAAVDINSTDKGLLIPRMTQEQISLISAPANGLQVFCTDNGKLYIYVATLGQWKEVAYASDVITPPFICGMPLTRTHTEGPVAPVTKTVTYGTVTGIPGETTKCWITSNLGADHQATAVDDATEESAGWYWQFNRQQGYKHTGSARTPNTTWISSISDNSDWLTANDPCALLLGSGWRLPNRTEWTNVDASGGWTNWNGPWSTALKMHAAGSLYHSNGSLSYRGMSGTYWSSTQYDSSDGWYLNFYSNVCEMSYYKKALGYTARCLRD